MGLELSQAPPETQEGPSGEGSGAAPAAHITMSWISSLSSDHLISRLMTQHGHDWLFLLMCFSSLQLLFTLISPPALFFFLIIILSFQFRKLARHPLGLSHTVFVQLLLSEVFSEKLCGFGVFSFLKVTSFKKNFVC